MRAPSRALHDLVALAASITLFACGPGAAVSDAGLDAAGDEHDARTGTDDASHANDSSVDADASATDAGVDDGAMPDGATNYDAAMNGDASVVLDAGVHANDGSITELDAGVEPDAAVEADAGTDAGTDAAVEPSAYRLEIWGFTVPSMRRRFQVAAPGYTNWQTHDPEASLLAKRGPDVIVGVGFNRSAAYDNTLTLSASEATVSDTYSSLASLASALVGFVDYEQNGDITPIPVAEIEGLAGCAVGWMSAEQVADTLATGNIQTSTCPSPVHAGSGTAMFNADFQIDWRIVAVP